MKYDLKTYARIVVSGERGEIIARSESITSEPQYLLRYKSADGRAVEQWWPESALSQGE